MQPISKHYSVEYTKASKLTFEDELPDVASDTAYFETEEEAKTFIRKLCEPNEYWEMVRIYLNITETYLG